MALETGQQILSDYEKTVTVLGDPEKSAARHVVERAFSNDTLDIEATYDDRINALTADEQRNVVRRIDIRLVITCGLMYFVALMDRTNLGLAAVGGMAVDMQLIGSRYSILVLVFFLTYILLQPPATVILRKLGPRVFLPLTMLLCGITTICFGFVKEWTQMIPLRLVLGMAEAGFFPGAVYLLSTWYPRYDLHKRNAVLFLIGTLLSALSGILAYGFTKMNTLGNLGDPAYGQHYGPTTEHPRAPVGVMPGIAGWRWIFFWQGTLTAVVAVIGAVAIVDFPEKAATKSKNPFALSFLTEREAAFVVARIEKDRHDAVVEPFSVKRYLANAADMKLWAFASLFGLTTAQGYGITFFLPYILTGMGFNAAAAQCLVAPPFAFGAIYMFAIAVHSDKSRVRGVWVAINASLSLLGLCLLAFAQNVGVRYFGVMLAVAGCDANVPTILTYQANNIRGQWKRAFASANMVAFGGIAGVIGSTVFRSQDAPAYIPGMVTLILASVLMLLITAVLTFSLRRSNKRADADGQYLIEGLSGFRYTL